MTLRSADSEIDFNNVCLNVDGHLLRLTAENLRIIGEKPKFFYVRNKKLKHIPTKTVLKELAKGPRITPDNRWIASWIKKHEYRCRPPPLPPYGCNCCQRSVKYKSTESQSDDDGNGPGLHNKTNADAAKELPKKGDDNPVVQNKTKSFAAAEKYEKIRGKSTKIRRDAAQIRGDDAKQRGEKAKIRGQCAANNGDGPGLQNKTNANAAKELPKKGDDNPVVQNKTKSFAAAEKYEKIRGKSAKIRRDAAQIRGDDAKQRGEKAKIRGQCAVYNGDGPGLQNKTNADAAKELPKKGDDNPVVQNKTKSFAAAEKYEKIRGKSAKIRHDVAQIRGDDAKQRGEKAKIRGQCVVYNGDGPGLQNKTNADAAKELPKKGDVNLVLQNKTKSIVGAKSSKIRGNHAKIRDRAAKIRGESAKIRSDDAKVIRRFLLKFPHAIKGIDGKKFGADKSYRHAALRKLCPILKLVKDIRVDQILMGGVSNGRKEIPLRVFAASLGLKQVDKRLNDKRAYNTRGSRGLNASFVKYTVSSESDNDTKSKEKSTSTDDDDENVNVSRKSTSADDDDENVNVSRNSTSADDDDDENVNVSRKSTSADDDDENVNVSRKSTSADDDDENVNVSRKSTSAYDDDDENVNVSRKSTSADDDDENVNVSRKSTSADDDDENVNVSRKSTSADDDDENVNVSRKSTSADDDDENVNVSRKSTSADDDDENVNVSRKRKRSLRLIARKKPRTETSVDSLDVNKNTGAASSKFMPPKPSTNGNCAEMEGDKKSKNKRISKEICKNKLNNSGGWREYSNLEEHAIVSWVSVGGRDRLVNGNKLWKELEREHEKITGIARTWQSLRNRYLRYILPSLGTMYLDANLQKKLRSGAAKGSIKLRRKRFQNVKKLPVLSAFGLLPRPRLIDTSDRETRETPDRETRDRKTRDRETRDRKTRDRETPDRETRDRKARDRKTRDRETPDRETPDRETRHRVFGEKPHTPTTRSNSAKKRTGVQWAVQAGYSTPTYSELTKAYSNKLTLRSSTPKESRSSSVKKTRAATRKLFNPKSLLN